MVGSTAKMVELALRPEPEVEKVRFPAEPAVPRVTEPV